MLLLLACSAPFDTAGESPLPASADRCDLSEVGQPAIQLQASALVPPLREPASTAFEDMSWDTLVHLVDADARGGFVYGAGTGGLRVFDTRDGIDIAGLWVERDLTDLTFVRALGNGTVVVSGPGGTAVVDVRDPQDPQVVERPPLWGVAGVWERDEDVVLLDGDGLWSMRDDRVQLLQSWPGLRGLTALEDGAAVFDVDTITVLDADLGVVETVSTPAVARDVAVLPDGRLVAALGSQGVGFYDGQWAVTPVPGTAVDVQLVEDQVWVATMHGVAQLDLEGRLVDHRPTREFTLALAPSWGGVLAMDWNYVHQLFSTGQPVPVATTSHHELVVDGQASLWLTNPGQDALAVHGWGSDEGLDLTPPPTWLDGGQSVELDVTAEPGSQGTLCIATDAPSTPVLEVRVRAGEGVDVHVGQSAPDFTLNDLDGATWRLSEHAGRPVVLVFFSAWCPICPPEIQDLAARADELDAEVWLIAPLDQTDALEEFRQRYAVPFPILLDTGATVWASWQQADAEMLFPQNWVVGPDGRIVYAANSYSFDALRDAVSD